MKSILVLIIVFAEIFGINFSFYDSATLYNPEKMTEPSVNLTKFDLAQAPSYPTVSKNYYKPQLTSESYLVYDKKSAKVLASKKANVKRPIASITKLMTAIVAMENMDLNETIEVPKSVSKTTGSKIWIDPGLKFELSQLMKGMLIKSANDCAYTIGNGYDNKNRKGDFVKLMNEKAQKLEMTQTTFHETTGLSEKNVSTANDLVNLANYALKYDFIAKTINTYSTTITSVEGYSYDIYSTNRMLRTDEDIFGLKTGYLEEAGQCLIAGSNLNGTQIISIVLGASDNNLRFVETRNLIDWARTSYNW